MLIIESNYDMMRLSEEKMLLNYANLLAKGACIIQYCGYTVLTIDKEKRGITVVYVEGLGLGVVSICRCSRRSVAVSTCSTPFSAAIIDLLIY